ITKQGTELDLTPENATAVFGEDSGMFATLSDVAERPFNEKTVIFQVNGDNGSYAVAAITDFNGRAFLGTVPLPPGTYTVDATFGDAITLNGDSIDLTDDRYLPSTATGTLIIEEAVDEVELIYMSAGYTGEILGEWVRNEDIYVFDLATEEWTLVFDGSDVGLYTANVNGLAKLEDGSLLLNLGHTRWVPGLGKVYRNDIVRFIPTSLGEDTAGTFELYFDGSDVGLKSAAETIDAIAFDENGRLLISTISSFNVNGLRGKGADILAFTATSLGSDTSGSWELYFDGSDVGLGNRFKESISGLWIDSDNNPTLSTSGKFKINNDFKGRGYDVFVCDAVSLGPDTSCNYSFFWRGTDYGIDTNTINALWLE
ncbi:MAG: Ig-like domain repeat protein, partial [Chloroflexi bacterium]